MSVDESKATKVSVKNKKPIGFDGHLVDLFTVRMFRNTDEHRYEAHDSDGNEGYGATRTEALKNMLEIRDANA